MGGESDEGLEVGMEPQGRWRPASRPTSYEVLTYYAELNNGNYAKTNNGNYAKRNNGNYYL